MNLLINAINRFPLLSFGLALGAGMVIIIFLLRLLGCIL